MKLNLMDSLESHYSNFPRAIIQLQDNGQNKMEEKNNVGDSIINNMVCYYGTEWKFVLGFVYISESSVRSLVIVLARIL